MPYRYNIYRGRNCKISLSFSQRVSVSLPALSVSHGCTSWLIFAQSGSKVTTPKSKNEFFGGQHCTTTFSVIPADMLRDLVTLTFNLLTLVSGHTWRVTWSISRPSLKILQLSGSSHRIPMTMRLQPLHMRHIMWLMPLPLKTTIFGRKGPENPCKHKYANFCL